MTWRFVYAGFHDGLYNMGADEETAIRVRDGVSSPVVRLYGWMPPAVSIGINQNETDFDLQALRSAGFGFVRRPTGGRAILHANEVTYSVSMPLGNRGLRELYRWINEGLLEGLRLLGIDASLSDHEADFRRLYADPSSIPCFASSAKSEIQFEGRKLVGSAQRRYGSAILQHGSILLGPEHRRIAEFLAPHVRDFKDVIEDALLAGTIDASSLLGRAVTFEEAAECIRRGFERRWGVIFEESADDAAALRSPSPINEPEGVQP